MCMRVEVEEQDGRWSRIKKLDRLLSLCFVSRVLLTTLITQAL